MDNIFFVELIITSYNNAFDSESYIYEESTFLNKGRSIEFLNEYIKSNFKYRFLTELRRRHILLKENDKVELHSFLVKIKEASYLLNNSVLLYKENAYKKSKRINLIGSTDEDRDLFFDTIECYEESYHISLSSIINKAKKEILFNLIDVSFITQTIDNLSFNDFEKKYESKEIDLGVNDHYLGEATNKEAYKLFEFLCEYYMRDKKTSVKYINILHYLKNDVDKKIYIFHLTQEKYRVLIFEKTRTTISKFSKSEKYDEVEKPILDALVNTFEEV
jgi:hypothetical protein